jgi:hypothetical protein
MTHQRFSPVHKEDESHEPTAAARLSINSHGMDVNISGIPPRDVRDLIMLIASLSGLVVLAVICPVITLQEGRHVLSPDMTEFFFALELMCGVIVALWLYRIRR